MPSYPYCIVAEAPVYDLIEISCRPVSLLSGTTSRWIGFPLEQPKSFYDMPLMSHSMDMSLILKQRRPHD